ncbi:MAG: tRNA (adenosine(37)-N6)-dimethylallyltransferase MiaA [Deltaproteobacteria bacterium GWC2_42_11]|nr:MAG: tRNA (adenosine(37)-N6)-dimethylallyltransferase MiaA [Deltaproteobacteria bacterium GWC2_42_11]HBO84828.1 tRNA (adenosine(37)-N6)-dimethylallyltransferase MiaA [Deltaproteobacteria bacterium]
MNRVRVAVIAGPTASGKSKAAIELAKIFNVEIISADSMQVYRFMDIGTAKPSSEERAEIKHHMIDIANPDEDYTAARFKNEASKAIEDVYRRGKNIFVVGGTGLYIRTLIKGLFMGPGKNEKLRQKLKDLSEKQGSNYIYNILKKVDPSSASKIHPNNKVRIIRAIEVYFTTKRTMSSFQTEHGFLEKPYDVLYMGLKKERKELYRDIEARVDRMVDNGLINEVKGLIDMGYSPESKAMQALGYREAAKYLNGKLTFENMAYEIKKNTKRYAKRQITWFNKEPDIRWVDANDINAMVSMIRGFLTSQD